MVDSINPQDTMGQPSRDGGGALGQESRVWAATGSSPTWLVILSKPVREKNTNKGPLELCLRALIHSLSFTESRGGQGRGLSPSVVGDQPQPPSAGAFGGPTVCSAMGGHSERHSA